MMSARDYWHLPQIRSHASRIPKPWNKIAMLRSPDPFCSRPNTKEKRSGCARLRQLFSPLELSCLWFQLIACKEGF